MKKISLCLTNYNRFELLIESFSKVMSDDRIDDIVISDDCSDPDIYLDLLNAFRHDKKVRMSRNQSNQDCYHNKRTAIGLAKNEYVIILDSDNKIDPLFVDAIYEHEWHPDLILAPEFARPTFDYTRYGGMTISAKNVAQMLGYPMFETMLNTMNYFVNRDAYIAAWDGSCNPVTADSIYQNYNFMRLGGMIHVTRGMQYDHLVHDGSHYKLNNHKTGNFYSDVIQKIKLLK